jgi:Protein of unknown function (DUF1153)/Transcriptional regulatory protein, C terminal
MVNEYASPRTEISDRHPHPRTPADANDCSGPLRYRRSTPKQRVAARRADGSLLCLSDLPQSGQRWTRSRKRIVIECLSHGLIGAEAVIARYNLSTAELAEWCAMVEQRGRPLPRWDSRPRTRAAARVSAGSAEIDVPRRMLRVNGVRVAVTDSEWRVLAALAEAGGHVVTTAMLMAAVYPATTRPRAPKIIDVLICRLRKKLGAEADRVSAIWGRGYLLCCDEAVAAA